MLRLSIFLLATVPLALSSCVTSAPGLADWDSLTPDGRRDVALRVLAESAVTAFTGDRYEVLAPPAAGQTPQRLVGGFVPGRVPGRRSELVIVGGSLDGPEAPVLIEAARQIALDARSRLRPERTVLLALWRGQRTGTTALDDLLAVPLWSAAGRRAVLDASGAAARTGKTRIAGVPLIPIFDPETQPWQAAVDAVVQAVLTAAAAPPDTD